MSVVSERLGQLEKKGVRVCQVIGRKDGTVSLYNRPGCEGVDHSLTAVGFGGGGHKGACGFSVPLEKAIDLGIVA